MRLWKKLLVLGLLLGLSSPAWAASFAAQGGSLGSAGENLNTYVCRGVESNAGECNNAILGAPIWVKGFKLVVSPSAGDVHAFCALYDATTVGASASIEPKDELNESVAGDTDVHIWPSPIRFGTGVSIAVSANSACIVYY